MRVVVSIMCLVFLSSGIIAAIPADLSESIVSTTWTKNSGNSKIYLDFKEPSYVDIIKEDENGNISWKTAYWSLEKKDNKNRLLIQYTFGAEPVVFDLVNIGEGIQLFGDVDFMTLNDNATNMGIKEASIFGNWKTEFIPLNEDSKPTTKRMKVGFEFMENGTFIKRTQIEREIKKEVGVWDLSNDGQFIKLRYAEKGNIENIYHKEILKIDTFSKTQMQLVSGKNKNSNDHSVTKWDFHKS